MAKAEFHVTILEDGIVKYETDLIDKIHHKSAEEFVEELKKELGGLVDTQAKAGKLRHTHHTDSIHIHHKH